MGGTWSHGGRTTPVGFEPTRGDPIGLAGQRLSRSAKVSLRHAQETNVVLSSGQCRLVYTIPANFGVISLLPKLEWGQTAVIYVTVQQLLRLKRYHEQQQLCEDLKGVAQHEDHYLSVAERHLWDSSPRGETPSA